ncbi:MAG: S8 family peptidase [Bacteroidales bacterium]|nr:S8 family peptidase [Bacteroidales bacterium]
MMKKLLLLCLWLGISACVYAQNPTCYRIYLSDKNNSPYSIDNPSEYLSPRAIEKRARFNIPITEQDFPVNPQYKQQILALDADMQLLSVSKWMNTVTVYCPDSVVVPQILNLPFVDSIMAVGNYILHDPPVFQNPENPISIVHSSPNPTKDAIDYGEGLGQIALLNGVPLHEEGFHGEGMLIAVIDGGFFGIETTSFYQQLVNEGRFFGHYSLMPNFVDTLESGWDEVHGTIVTSAIAANTNGELVGTAPGASYALIHTEWVGSEEIVEEDFWANGAEIADSLGADVINSSLGYRMFPDFPQSDITYANMDGVNSIASRCATILGQKGVIVCVAAGNDGSGQFYYVNRPGDAFDILCVGACSADSVIAEFSSHGPSYDGRVKPDITSQGVATACYYPYDMLSFANGTSLATPVAAGMCACLWQAMPQYTSSEIMQMIRESGHLYNNPNTEFGYGIPNFYQVYASHVGINDYNPLRLSVYPNPATDKLCLTNTDGNIQSISIFNATGQLVLQHSVNGNPLIEINVTSLPKGFYVGTATLDGNKKATFKFVK